MSEPVTQPARRRPALVLGASLLLLALVLLCIGAAVLPLRSPTLLAEGLERSLDRVEAAFTADVPADLRERVRAELRAQVQHLRTLDPRTLSPDQARAAANPAERLTDLLADERLGPTECRGFLELGGRSRSPSP